MAKTVLVLDDSLAMRRMIAHTLESYGYEVLQSAHAAGGLALLDERAVHLIIADVNMPAMDGIAFVKNARQKPNGREVPILMLTAENLNSRVREGREAGASGWLIKPFRPERLVEVVGRLLV